MPREKAPNKGACRLYSKHKGRSGGLQEEPSVQKGHKHKEFFYIKIMVEPLLSGIVLGLVPITIIGLFVTAYLQYKRGDRLL